MKKLTAMLVALLLTGMVTQGFAQQGYSMGNAIVAGTYNSPGSFTDSRNSGTGYTNNFGNPANDIWYRFTLSSPATLVQVSLCGSDFDTWVHVLNSSETEIAGNDDNTSACPGTRSYVELANLAAGTYYIVTEGYSNYFGTVNLSLNVNITPPMALSYGGSQTYTTGTAISPLVPAVTGGTPTNTGQTTLTLAGAGYLGALNGTGTGALFDTPIGTAVDAAGNVYVADSENELIRKITPAGAVSTFAGNGNVKGSANGTGTAATFNHPASVGLDASGNVYVVDQMNNLIRKITPSGVVSTFAGSGSAGSANGTGTAASFNNPTGLALDGSGNVYVADYGNHKIRKITPSGVVTTYAGTGTQGATNGAAASATFKGPFALDVDATGNIYVADRLNFLVRKITAGGVVSTLAGSGVAGYANGTGTAASFDPPNGIAIDAVSGNIFVTDVNNHSIRKVTPAGVVTTFAGTQTSGFINGTGGVVRFYRPYGLSVDTKGDLYIADTYNHSIRKMIRQAYTIEPQLPAGLTFNNTTGTISGTPTAISPSTNYTITAYNETSTATYTLNITVTTPSVNDVNKNWIYTRNYDEDGNEVGSSKAFFDNEGKLLQTQVKNETTGQILASQPLYDFQGRGVGSTLSAPINSTTFTYKTNFVKNTSGGSYSYTNFDGHPDPDNAGYLNKVNNPDPVANTEQGTLGWYYSNNNTTEPYVASTAYPYSRTEFYRDGSGAGKRSAGIGEALKMGAGHETISNSFPVINELTNYLAIRTKVDAVIPLGSNPSLAGKALQNISMDPNGQQAISVTDLSGKLLMTGRADPNGWLTVNNTFMLTSPPNTFRATIKMGSIITVGEDDNFIDFKILTTQLNQSVKIYQAGTLIYSGIGDNLTLRSILASGINQVTFDITSLQPFYYECEKTVAYSGSGFQGNTTAGPFASKKDEPATSTIQYFQLTSPGIVNITGTYALYDMGTEAPISSFTSGSTLPAGYYKVVAVTGTNVTVSYTNKYSDLSYNYYNALGQLVASIAPNGVKAYLDNPSGYASFNDIPFVTRYTYDLKGRLTATQTTDAGTTEYIYRKDGKIRFSQNALQRNKKVVSGVETPIDPTILEKFSYTHYDKWGRPIESGEYTVPLAGTQTFTSLKTNNTILEAYSTSGGLTGGAEKFDVNTYYDTPGTLPADATALGYVQNEGFLRGAVSYAKNDNSTTWYNYDDQGRVTWIVKSLVGITSSKTIDYTYDAKGNVVQVDYQKNTPAERFIHHYDYDVDSRLVNVKTSRDGVTKLQHAKYYYYQHGPLKRVELGDNLQGIDYVYTAQGMLKSVNHSSGDPSKDPGKDGYGSSLFLPDAFGMQTEYFPNDYSRTGSNIASIATGQPSYYDGNVNGISWQSKKPASIVSSTPGIQNPTMYTYNYDSKYQLNNAIWGTPNFTTNAFTASPTNIFQEKGLAYDANGNIKSLQRTNSAGALSDNFLNAYQYEANTNKLNAVNTYATYTYDELGRLKSETKGATSRYLKYDVTGNITGVYSNEAMTTALITYAYDELGNRIKSNIAGGTITYYIYDASGNVMATYTGSAGTTFSEVPVYGAERLGMYNVSGGSYVYEMRDNVGSVRAVINRNRTSGGALDVLQYNDYYPFGSIARQGGNGYKYEYQGLYAEKDPATGWNNFDLRMYDGKIGRWLSVDPKNQYYSPYLGMGNNPVSKTDPTGGTAESPIFDSTTGQLLGVDSEGFRGELIFMSALDYNLLSDNGKITLDHQMVENYSGSIKAKDMNGVRGSFAFANAVDYIVKQMSEFGTPSQIGANLYKGKISTFEWETGLRSNGGDDLDPYGAAKTVNIGAKAKITFNQSTSYLLNTVENIQSTFVHEYKGHFLLGIGYDSPATLKIEQHMMFKRIIKRSKKQLHYFRKVFTQNIIKENNEINN